MTPGSPQSAWLSPPIARPSSPVIAFDNPRAIAGNGRRLCGEVASTNTHGNSRATISLPMVSKSVKRNTSTQAHPANKRSTSLNHTPELFPSPSLPRSFRTDVLHIPPQVSVSWPLTSITRKRKALDYDEGDSLPRKRSPLSAPPGIVEPRGIACPKNGCSQVCRNQADLDRHLEKKIMQKGHTSVNLVMNGSPAKTA